jgi:hypothetical protein
MSSGRTEADSVLACFHVASDPLIPVFLWRYPELAVLRLLLAGTLVGWELVLLGADGRVLAFAGTILSVRT